MLIVIITDVFFHQYFFSHSKNMSAENNLEQDQITGAVRWHATPAVSLWYKLKFTLIYA